MTNLNIRIDSDVKNQFDEICGNIGLSMSSAFNVFAKAVIRDRKIPFELKDE
ncbi:MAG: type II toxin-antitoxin system RelB/DinJ family antitoxin, partial [Lachnospiraceae bacterium]|nr:type II toxin-antitoxin system RelB/DinJ family antitoxin [Lachnospiraceae bacterium]